MEWRVSWAALWAALICDMPTRNTSEAPTNRQTAPAVRRCETLRDWVDDFTMAMDTLRATDFIWGFHPGSSRGRSPDFAGRWFHAGLPGFLVALFAQNLAAYSCGGSHGFGPIWVVRTVFPVRLFTVWFLSTELCYCASPGPVPST